MHGVSFFEAIFLGFATKKRRFRILGLLNARICFMYRVLKIGLYFDIKRNFWVPSFVRLVSLLNGLRRMRESVLS